MESKDIDRLVLSQLAQGKHTLIDGVCSIEVKRVGSSTTNPKKSTGYPHRALIFTPEEQGESLRERVGAESFNQWLEERTTIKGSNKIIKVDDVFTVTINKKGEVSGVVASELNMQLNPFGNGKQTGAQTSRVKRAVILSLIVIIVPSLILLGIDYIQQTKGAPAIIDNTTEGSITIDALKQVEALPVIDTLERDSLKGGTLNTDTVTIVGQPDNQNSTTDTVLHEMLDKE